MPCFEHLSRNFIFECSVFTFDIKWKRTCVQTWKQTYMKAKHTSIQKSYVFADPMYIISENSLLVFLVKNWNFWYNTKDLYLKIKYYQTAFWWITWEGFWSNWQFWHIDTTQRQIYKDWFISFATYNKYF